MGADMKPYLNLNGDSYVVSFKVSEDSIMATFKDGKYKHYLYNSLEPGRTDVERMKVLAVLGCGLN
jgi:hypothetical protein